MPKQKTKKLKLKATSGENVTVNVPVDLKQPPALDLKIADHMMNKKNWKLQTEYLIFKTKARANAVGKALQWYLGGYEIEKVKGGWRVGSKGYYHYIGS